MESLPLFFSLAVALGLLGFVEPCSVGSHLLFIKYLEARPAAERLGQTTVFTLTRACFMASLGLLAAALGAGFTGLQQTFWGVLGGAYVVLGLFYLGGGAGWLMHYLQRLLPALPGKRTGAALGVFFGLNIPACAAPLLALLLGGAAAESARTASVLPGTLALFLFGLALSSPLVLAVVSRRGQRLLDWLAALSGRMPRWTGAVLILLGGWSILQALAT